MADYSTMSSSESPSSSSFCVCCNGSIEPTEQKTFEQRLVEDNDFCIRCWNEIITFVSDDDLLPFLVDAFAAGDKKNKT